MSRWAWVVALKRYHRRRGMDTGKLTGLVASVITVIAFCIANEYPPLIFVAGVIGQALFWWLFARFF